MVRFDFLTSKECFEEELEVFEKRGLNAKFTDYASLLGSVLGLSTNYANERCYWTKSVVQKKFGNYIECVTYKRGGSEWVKPGLTDIGSRVVFVPDNVNEIMNDYNKEKTEDGLIIVTYGYYPGNAASKKIQEELNKAKTLTYTGAVVRCPGYIDGNLRVNEMNVISYKDKYYVKFGLGTVCGDVKLSNGETYDSFDNVWLEVEPIKLIYIKEHNKFLCENVLFSGVHYNKEFETDFEKTDIKTFLDNCFGKDVLRLKDELYNEQNVSNNENEFNFKRVTEEDIIKGCIMSDVPVFLHGKTGEGKSSRVKQLDPNAQVIYLQTVTPESLNGRNVYNESTGESIDKEPTWYKKLCERCNDEPDKLHIVFFDELTNATHTLQGMIYNIVLDREINGIWKLPSNARIVAAGNEKDESLSANELSAPLFSRFAHVYIETSPEAFLRWGSTPRTKGEAIDNEESKVIKKIHPAIISFIKYKHDSGEDILRTPYNGVTPNADPRKWEMASKMLYETGNPYMLRSLVGTKLTNEFVGFIREYMIDDTLEKQKTLTIK